MNKGKRAKNFKDKVQDFKIAKAARCKPYKDREKLAEDLKKEIDWDGIAPEIEVIMRRISYWRSHTPPDTDEDKPWHLFDLVQEQTQSLPLILKAQKYFSQGSPHFSTHQLTIREAKWISRLSYIYNHGTEREKLMSDYNGVLADRGRRLTMLFNLSEEFAYIEKLDGEFRDHWFAPEIEQQLYYEFTGKGPLEPVIDSDGYEAEPEAIRLIRLGLKNMKEEGSHERPNHKTVEKQEKR